MAVSAGRRLGPYEIVSPIGAGGMGEVYKARDARLNRFVAIKVLPDEVSADPDRLRRFEREARAASALNHPNIVTVHDVGVSGSTSYLAMELVEGKTLRDLLLPGPLPIKKLLDIAAQIADGLAAAHEAGIVHRDLKPRNVIVTREGHVKIVDFGLAKQPVSSDADLGKSGASTLSERGTLSGEVVGTVEYMSPEQARGKPIDYRSDQFSFGTLLYEMSTGKHAFARSTPADTLVAVLQLEPEALSRLQPDLPVPMRWIIERCLAKAPEDRYLSTRDLHRDLRTLKERLDELSEVDQVRPSAARAVSRRTALFAAGLSLVGAAGLWLLISGISPRRASPDFRRLTFRNGVVSRALFVPHSDSILYTASWDGQPARSYLTLQESYGRDRPLDGEVQLPLAYSGDGSQVLVLLGLSRAPINARGTLAWWPSLGGRPRRLMDGAGWADWAPSGQFLAVVRDLGSERVLDIRDSNGNLRRTIFRTIGAINYVRISPDEKRVAFIHHPSRSYEAGAVEVADVTGSWRKTLTPNLARCVGLDWNSRTGEIWFTASKTSGYESVLGAVGLNGKWRTLYTFPESLTLQRISDTSDRVLMTAADSRTSLTIRRGDGNPRDLSWLGWSIAFDISPDEKSVLFMDGGTTENSSGMYMRSLDGEDTVRLGDGEPGAFSPDGRWVVGLTSPVPGPQQVVLVPVESGKAQQLTFTKSSHSTPSFAGATTILFVRSEQEKNQVWRISVDGSGARPIGVTDCDLPKANPSGNAFVCRGGEFKGALFVYPITGGAARKLYELPNGEYFLYARWNREGDQILAISKDGSSLVIDAASARILRRQPPPSDAAESGSFLIAAVLNAEGTVQAYSFLRSSSALYLAKGL